jgi:hypothetical protein
MTMPRDLTNREWLAYWIEQKVSDPAESAAMADKLCEKAGATRREFIKARKSGEIAKGLDDEDESYLAAVASGFIEEEE